MPAFFARGYWCEDCNTAYNDRSSHRCKNVCSSCYSKPPCSRDSEPVYCGKCNRFFYGHTCFESHTKAANLMHELTESCEALQQNMKAGSTVCERIQRCKKCKCHINRAHTMQHRCGYFRCRTCNLDVLKEGHICYMQPDKMDVASVLSAEHLETDHFNQERPPKRKRSRKETIHKFVFFDFETSQEKFVKETEHGSIYEHVPNLCIAHVVCDHCQKPEIVNGPELSDECVNCGPKQRVFSGPNCLKEFCQFLFQKEMENTTTIAHNAKAFDSQFIMQHLHSEGIAPSVVTKGLNIISLRVNTIKVIDSFCYLPMPLAALPKAFGIEELSKGYSPHLFNRKENWMYIGPWPDIQYYSPEQMKPDEYAQFQLWYQEQHGKIFNFRLEIFKYCESDVNVLEQACLKFCALFMKETSVDPFKDSVTIAGACNRVFRNKFMKKDTIGLVPHNGYRGKDKQSAKAITWLQWLSKKNNIQIKHALNGKEVRIGPYKVDGLCGNIVYEFYGCYWHGCPRCMKQPYQLTADQSSTAQDAYLRTMERRFFIMQQGYQIIELWECQLAEEIACSIEMKMFFQHASLLEPLNPREAFYGGRTNAIKLHHKVAEDSVGIASEKIKYVDICSLYPYTNKYGLYPVGHPQIITENFELVSCENRPYEGLIKCFILPPRDLYHPVLPYRSNGKLMFPLCGFCADMLQNDEQCIHDDESRILLGTWVTSEIYKALEKGYTVIKIIEVWHYAVTDQYDPVKKPDGGLFTEYVNAFMKLKMEAEGWPKHCNDTISKEKFITSVYEREGIYLNPNDIAKNKGKRALAKLMLNSFWGKFGQRNNLTKLVYFDDACKYFKLILDPAIIVHSITIVNEFLVAVSYTEQDDMANILPYSNPVIAAYTTAQARLALYSYIEKLDKRVLYFDTDSVIYVSNPLEASQYEIPLGCSLGDMTDELAEFGESSYIVEFVSGGPKNYAYKVFSTLDNRYHYRVKVRGITLSYATSQKINFECLKKFVFDFVENGRVNFMHVLSSRIDKSSLNRVITRPQQKIFKIVHDKRVVLPDFYTIPYGFSLNSL